MPEWILERNDLKLQPFGRTKLYPAPAVSAHDFFGLTPIRALTHTQFSVSCAVFALIRIPGLAHYMNFSAPGDAEPPRPRGLLLREADASLRLQRQLHELTNGVEEGDDLFVVG